MTCQEAQRYSIAFYPMRNTRNLHAASTLNEIRFIFPIKQNFSGVSPRCLKCPNTNSNPNPNPKFEFGEESRRLPKSAVFGDVRLNSCTG